jgi:hypothetical protein
MKKRLAVFCVAIWLGALLLGCGSVEQGPSNGGNGETETTEAAPYIALRSVDNKLAIIVDTSMVLTEYEADHLCRNLTLTYSQDGSAALCLTEEGALLYIHDGTVEVIAENPYSYCLSPTGDAVAFQIENVYGPPSDLAPGLYLYEKETRESKLIFAEEEGFTTSCVFSPDGKTLAFVAAYPRWENSVPTMYTYRDGTVSVFANISRYPGLRYLISVNNAMDVIYLHDGFQVYSMNGQKQVTKHGDIDTRYLGDTWVFRVYTNADHTQLLYFGYGTYLLEPGKEPVMLCDAAVDPVKPALSFFYDANGVFTCPVQDLKQGVYYSGEVCFWRFDESDGFVNFASSKTTNKEDYWLDPTGSYLYYRNQNGELYLLDLKNGGRKTLLVDFAYDYAISYDCGKVYYLDGDGFKVCSGLEVSEFEAASVQLETWRFGYSENNALFVTARTDGLIYDIYRINQAGKATKVLENVAWFEQYDFGMIYMTAGEDHYIIRNGEVIQLEIKTLQDLNT